MKLAALFSGGKDSCLALHKAIKEGHEIKYLLSITPKNFDSFMFHKPYLKLLKKQAERLKIDLITQKSDGEEDKELEDLKKLIEKVKDEVDGIVVGGIASNYQGSRIKKICNELGLKFYAPLWDYKSEDVWKELLKEKFKVVLTKISCEGINEKWLGGIIDDKKFNELKKLSDKYNFRIDFEGGEAETAVLFMPGFNRKIKIDFEVKNEGKYRHFLDIIDVK
ncbi:MAG: diphthine--ammonia ligase [Candidatus Nanoarchaeia archaeon]|nr:diphthine--ammonia ligase [Candidatus Nanoarchaeia archaeon]MDD5741126.1 diphthine--ammonia ligase [Candidatus Nanoarchaeia archaeon]